MNPQDVERGLYEDNPLAELIEGFHLMTGAAGELEARPVIHVQLRRAARLSAVEADRLAKACQYGIQHQLAADGGVLDQSPDEDPSVNEIAIELHPYGTGPFADAPSPRDTRLRCGDG
jgi:phenylacetate-CoA ligase